MHGEFRNKNAESIVRCDSDQPDIFVITEILLDLASILNLVLPGFECVARDSTFPPKTMVVGSRFTEFKLIETLLET